MSNTDEKAAVSSLFIREKKKYRVVRAWLASS
jgi:hypothetical protein